jgi:hypothetical protein
MTFFSSSASVSFASVLATATITVTTGAGGSAGGSAEPSCSKPIPPGVIAGSVIGGLVIIAAASVALSYMLRRPIYEARQVPVMAEGAYNNPLVVSPTSLTPLQGPFLDVQNGRALQRPELGNER